MQSELYPNRVEIAEWLGEEVARSIASIQCRLQMSSVRSSTKPRVQCSSNCHRTTEEAQNFNHQQQNHWRSHCAVKLTIIKDQRSATALKMTKISTRKWWKGLPIVFLSKKSFLSCSAKVVKVLVLKYFHSKLLSLGTCFPRFSHYPSKKIQPVIQQLLLCLFLEMFTTKTCFQFLFVL